VKCKCPEGYPKTKTSFYQHLEGDKARMRYIGYLPIKVTYRRHSGECPITDEVLRLRRVA
jgi:hypothetical protein